MKATREGLCKAKQPVLELDFKGSSSDGITSYVCNEIQKIARSEGVHNQIENADIFQSYVAEQNAVGAVL